MIGTNTPPTSQGGESHPERWKSYRRVSLTKLFGVQDQQVTDAGTLFVEIRDRLGTFAIQDLLTDTLKPKSWLAWPV